MKFEVDDLKALAKDKNVKVDDTAGADSVYAALVGANVDVEAEFEAKNDKPQVGRPKATKAVAAPRASGKPSLDTEGTTLLRMTRKNPLWQERTYTWTRTHPYAIVKDEDVDYFVETIGGFQVATPNQIKSYYS